MFKAFRQRLRDWRTFTALNLGACKYAKADGHKEPGAEHYVLMALDLPDGTARNAFKRIHADPDRFHAAIARQYEEALQHIGVVAPSGSIVNEEKAPFPMRPASRVQESAYVLIKKLIYEYRVKEEKMYPGSPLIGAHVILAATTAQRGVAVRAFRAMGIDPERLAEAAKEEIVASRLA